MKQILTAKNIAVIGAAREEEKVGNVIFKNLIQNPKLKVYPVNPNAQEILGIRAYPDVLSIPYQVDLAVIVVKAELVPLVLEQCSAKKVFNVIIISAGFAETGNTELDNEVKETAEKYKIKILGPNVLGIINPHEELNISFFKQMPKKGNLSLVTQSGALGTAFLDKASTENLGFSNFISLGNMMNTDFIDALEYLEKDKNTHVISLYIESLKQETGIKFIELCKRISKSKPILALKAGQTTQGEQAAKTHTASLSSPSSIYSGAFKQAGIIEVESFEELFNLSLVLSRYKDLGNRAVIITNAGGFGVLATDACIESQIQLPQIPDKTIKELDKALNKINSHSNPLDILGDALAKDYQSAIKTLESEKFFDFFIVILTPQQMTQPLVTAQVLTKSKKPVLACYIGGNMLQESIKFLKQNQIPVFDDVSKLKILSKIPIKKSLIKRFFSYLHK